MGSPNGMPGRGTARHRLHQVNLLPVPQRKGQALGGQCARANDQHGGGNRGDRKTCSLSFVRQLLRRSGAGRPLTDEDGWGVVGVRVAMWRVPRGLWMLLGRCVVNRNVSRLVSDPGQGGPHRRHRSPVWRRQTEEGLLQRPREITVGWPPTPFGTQCAWSQDLRWRRAGNEQFWDDPLNRFSCQCNISTPGDRGRYWVCGSQNAPLPWISPR